MLKVLEIAAAEVGYLEKATNSQLDDKTANAGYGNYTKYARDLANVPGFYNGNKNGYAWCDVFVDWCFVQAYGVDNAKEMIEHTQLGAGCVYSARAYTAAHKWHAAPKVGDQIFFGTTLSDCYHTGLVYDIDDTYVYTIEGNTSSVSGVVANGGGVYKKRYSINYSKIVGYGRPDYGEEDDEMTGEEIYNKLMEYLETKETPAWAKAEMQEAVDAGITDGTRPMAFATRMETAIMTKRATK